LRACGRDKVKTATAPRFSYSKGIGFLRLK